MQSPPLVLDRLNIPTDKFTWEEIFTDRKTKFREDQLFVSYYLAPTAKRGSPVTPLVIIRFGEKLLNHLGLEVGEKLLLLSAKEDKYNYLMVKADRGYKITKSGNSYQFSFRMKKDGLTYFKSTSCQYILNNNATIRVIFPG